MYQLSFYVPVSHLEEVKAAIFATGAGKIGNYDCCCWQALGRGQFRALAGSDPFIGEQGKVETVDEYKVELVCAEDLIRAAVAALRAVHPYEEPAYHVTKLEIF
jgi:hypothetical protein